MIINKIYHLADLHIRNLQRHKEYKEIFKKFLKQVEDDKIEDSIIYLAGDIAHAKTEMSPELIREISWFLTECSKLRETFLITGNHDCNLNNNHRLDVLTPIIDNLNNPHIHYLRDTGVYNYNNITFVVYSILDKKENWPLAKDIEGENKICLFHGPVNKAQTDIGYVVSSNSFTVDMFEGFDMAMLGDIHKRQTFGEGWEHVAYAGSMVQQNHGEMLENHGYLLWDVPTRTFTEHHIHNDYGFLTIDVINGQIPQWVYDEIDTKLPKNPRLRLRFTNTEASEMKLRITELKELFNVAEVTVTRTDTIGQLKTNSKLNKNIVGNVKDETFQNQLIRDYLERQFLLEDSDLDKISDITGVIRTKKNKSVKEATRKSPYMLGFPSFVLNKYIKLLIDENYSVIIFDQFDIPNSNKKTRKLVGVHSKGTYIDELKSDANYMMCIYIEENEDYKFKNMIICSGISLIDLSTGHIYINEFFSTKNDNKYSLDDTVKLINSYDPSEILIFNNNLKTINEKELIQYLELSNRNYHLKSYNSLYFI